jgi:hypothetical protein
MSKSGLEIEYGNLFAREDVAEAMPGSGLGLMKPRTPAY